MSSGSHRFAIRFGRVNAGFTRLLGLGPARSYVVVDGDDIRVRMGWAFRARIPRRSIVEVSRRPYLRWAFGVHGWAGRWIVNGSGHNIVALRIEPSAPARVLGLPVRLKELWVSLVDPDGFEAAL